MLERDTLSREISDLNTVSYDNRFDAVSRIKGEYTPTIYSKCYERLKPSIRKKIAEETDIEFRRLTNFNGKLPSISRAKNETERNLIRTWLRIRDIVVQNKGRKNLCPCQVRPLITMKHMHEFEKIGGITLRIHGPSLSLQTLRERLEKQIPILKNKFGTKTSDDLHWIKHQFWQEAEVTGVEYDHGHFFAIKWIDEKTMLSTINDNISGSHTWEIIYSNNFIYHSIFPGPFYPVIGEGFCYEWDSQGPINHVKVTSNMVAIEPSGRKCGWYINRAFPICENDPIIVT